MDSFRLMEELKLELIRGYEPYVRTVASLTGASDDDARDAFHGAICRILARLGKRPAGNPVVAWRPYIIQSAVNELRKAKRARFKCFSQLNAEEQSEVARMETKEEAPPHPEEKDNLAAMAWRELARLPARERAVIKRRCHGESFARIAKRLRIEPSTAEAYWSRGIRRMADWLREFRNAA